MLKQGMQQCWRQQWYVNPAAAKHAFADPAMPATPAEPAVLLQVASAKSSLDDNKEELFDVIACYFPISFSPPPNNVHGITRQDLAAALQHALTCTPLFAPFFIPMLVEKLSSSLRLVLLDSGVELRRTFQYLVREL